MGKAVEQRLPSGRREPIAEHDGELIHGGFPIKGFEQLQAGIHQYIHYYNHDRIKLKLKGLSPVQYRTQALAAYLLTVQLLGVQFITRA